MYTQMIYDAYSVIVLRVANVETRKHSYGALPHLSSSKRGRAAENSCCVICVASEACPNEGQNCGHKCAANVSRNLQIAEKYATYGTLSRAGKLGLTPLLSEA
jgi:hypothetical protein